MTTNHEVLDFPTLKVPDNGIWRKDANCKGVTIELFFPSGKGRQKAEQVAEIKAYCDACVVRQDCLDFAVNNDIQHGIYGGLSPKERKKLSKSFCNGSEEGV